MTMPVWVEQTNGKFTATLCSAPTVRAEGETKDEAIDALVASLTPQPGSELVFVDFPKSDTYPPCTPEEAEAWREVVAGLYRERDEQKREEFPE